jgi:hypothetical protein
MGFNKRKMEAQRRSRHSAALTSPDGLQTNARPPPTVF